MLFFIILVFIFAFKFFYFNSSTGKLQAKGLLVKADQEVASDGSWIEGTFEVVISDDRETNTVNYEYYLVLNPDEKIKLSFKDSPPYELAGATVKLNFSKEDLMLRVSSDELLSGDLILVKLPTPNTTTTKKVATIIFNFPDNQIPVYPISTLRQMIFTGSYSTKNYYNEISYGQQNITSFYDPAAGDFYGSYQLPMNEGSSCTDSDINAWAAAARTIAQNNGYNRSNYTNTVYIFPEKPGGPCAWAGKGIVNGDSLWVQSDTDQHWDTETVSHELGHNFGLLHASSYICSENGIPVPISTEGNCHYEEYGDKFEVMGVGSPQRHMSAIYKDRLNWLIPANIQTVTTSGTYTLHQAIELTSTTTETIRIPRQNVPGTYYYVEYRKVFGFDNFNPSDPVVNGLLIRIGRDKSGQLTNTFLLDMHPQTATFNDAPLALNETFNDPYEHITIRNNGGTGSDRNISVTLQTVVTPPPSPPWVTDVDQNNIFYPYISCVWNRRVMSGYYNPPNYEFHPNENTTRGLAAESLAKAVPYSDPIPTGQQTFTDVLQSYPQWISIEQVAMHGVISGYTCGGTNPPEPCDPQNHAYFRPSNFATRAQFAKMVSVAANYNDVIPTGTQTFFDVPPTHPLWIFVERVVLHGAISGYTCGGLTEPCDGQHRPYFRQANNITRAQTAKIVSLTFLRGQQYCPG